MLDPQGAGQAHDISIVDGVPMVRRRRKVVSYNTERVRGICADCNNGWMSRLESAAKPILTPMILGEPVTLSTADQQVVAAWATKTALVLEYSHRDRPIVAPAQLLHFGQTQSPFPDSLVFLAAFDGEGWALNHGRASVPATTRSGEEVPILLIMTMCVGRLTLQVAASSHVGSTRRSALLQRDDQLFARRIFPASGQPVAWPPPIAMNRAQFYEFAMAEGTDAEIEELIALGSLQNSAARVAHGSEDSEHA